MQKSNHSSEKHHNDQLVVFFLIFQYVFNWYWVALYTCTLLRVVSINLIWLCYTATKISSELLLLPFSSSYSSEGCRLVKAVVLMFHWRLLNAAERERGTSIDALLLLSACRGCCFACLLSEKLVWELWGTEGWNCCSLLPGVVVDARPQITAPWKWQWARYWNSVTFVITSPPKGRLASSSGGTWCLAQKL